MNSTTLVRLSELALAGYGQFDGTGLPPTLNDLTKLNGDEFGFAASQARNFQSTVVVKLPTFSDATSPMGRLRPK